MAAFVVAGFATVHMAAQALPEDAANLTTQEIVKQAVANFNARESLPKNYTYLEKLTNHSSRFKTGPESDTYEVMELRGKAFRRRIAHNDVPLAGKSVEMDEAYLAKLDEANRKILEEEIKPGHTKESLAEAVRKILDDAGLEDWKPQGLALNQAESLGVVTFKQTLQQFKLPLGVLDQKFKLKAQKDVLLNGRKTYVVEADPVRAKHEDETVRNFKIRIWIDQEELQIVKAEGKALRDGPIAHADYAAFSSKDLSEKEVRKTQERLAKTELLYGADTIITQEWAKVNNEIWLPQRRYVKGWHVFLFDHPYTATAHSSTDPVEYETLDTNYKKFRVEHRILPAIASEQ